MAEDNPRDGVHTYDIYTEGTSKEEVGTKQFAEAVVARLGKKPRKIEVSRPLIPKRRSRRRASNTLASPVPIKNWRIWR